jgi:hypothetical protein
VQVAQHQEEMQHLSLQVNTQQETNRELLEKIVGVQIENGELRVRTCGWLGDGRFCT